MFGSLRQLRKYRDFCVEAENTLGFRMALHNKKTFCGLQVIIVGDGGGGGGAPKILGGGGGGVGGGFLRGGAGRGGGLCVTIE